MGVQIRGPSVRAISVGVLSGGAVRLLSEERYGETRDPEALRDAQKEVQSRLG